MKAKRWLDIFLIFAFLSLLGFYFYQNNFFRPQSKISSSLPVVKAKEILNRKTIIPLSAVNLTRTSTACTFFLKSSAEKEIQEFANDFIDRHFDQIIKTCAGAIPTVLQAALDKANEQCASSTREKLDPRCYAALLEAKTKTVVTIVNEDTPAVELDAVILLHIITSAFSNGDYLDHPEKNLDLVDTMLLKEPQFYNGYKLKLLILSMSSLAKKEYFQEMFYSTLEQAKEFKIKDDQLREIELAARGSVYDASEEGKQDLVEFIAYLDEENLKNPKEWIYDYYKAHALYRTGKKDRQQIISILQNALNKAPNQPRLISTIENLQSEDDSLHRHPFSISLSFNLTDL